MIPTKHNMTLAFILLIGFGSVQADSSLPMEQWRQETAASILDNGAAAVAGMSAEAQEWFKMELHNQRSNNMRRLAAETGGDSDIIINTATREPCDPPVSGPRSADVAIDDSLKHSVIQ